MSLATIETRGHGFLHRFQRLRSSLRRYQVFQGLAWSSLAAALGLGLLASADYLLELPFSARAVGLAAAGAVSLVILLTRVVLPLRWWTTPRTAAEIEARFPQLGQRIQTVVQYAGLAPGQIDAEGVTPSLVDALADETEAQADPLPLDRVVPWWRARAVAATTGLAILGLLTAAVVAPEWRIAIGRALLGRQAYTRLEIKPGDIRVDQGAGVPIVAGLAGRSPREVVLYTRPEGQADAPWRSFAMVAPDGAPGPKREAILEKIEAPIVYRIVAGTAASPTYRIDVRYPLVIRSFDVNLKPPAYTGAAPSTIKGGDLRVIEGTEATFRVAFDSPPASASLVLIEPSRPSRKDKQAAPRVIPLKAEGAAFAARFRLDKTLAYRIEATTPDGRVLPESKYKIDVIEDRAPRVAFEEPYDALEVHPIAEVLHRVRVADDFGLTRAGIVFQFGDGDEQNLVLRDFTKEATSTRKTGTLEEMLLLEKLAATPRDSVTYYAFAEDNHPTAPRRTDTELRYIDIRPFKREYKMAESGDLPPGEPGDLATLAELIARQRFNLNRSARLAKHKPGDRTAVDDPLKIAGFEETLVELTRGFTEGVEGIVGQRIEPLHQAEESMLAAVSALDHGQVAPAPRHMADALRHLIEARDTIRVVIGDDSPEAQRAMRAFDRMQAQKIRKPRKDQEEAEEIAEEIERLAQDEDFVYATLSGLKIESPDRKAEAKGQSGESGDPEPAEPEKKDARREAADRQEKIAGKARDLEEALKKLDVASDLSKARMARAAEAAEKASVDLARGSTKEATEDAKSGAAMLHELSRQLKGELARDVAEELAMARDLADELARREADLAQLPAVGQGSQPGDGNGKAEGRGKGQGEARGTAGDPAEADRLRDLEEAGRTLEQWLKDASLRAEGPSAGRTKDVLDEGEAARVVERMERITELARGGDKAAAQREAQELSRRLELLSRLLDVLHRDVVAPELAKLVEFDRRIAELTARLKELRTDADITEWHRRAAELIRDMEKAGLADAAAPLAEVIEKLAMDHGVGRWNWGVGDGRLRVGPLAYPDALVKVTSRIQQRMQDMILKDMAAARDEATPPQFRELVERYYEVLSKGGAK